MLVVQFPAQCQVMLERADCLVPPGLGAIDAPQGIPKGSLQAENVNIASHGTQCFERLVAASRGSVQVGDRKVVP